MASRFAAVWLVAMSVVAPLAAADEFTLLGTIDHVRDGDTIVVDGWVIRLKGVAAPEAKEPGGPAATAVMKAMEGRPVVCHVTPENSYDRHAGWCSLIGDDLGSLLLTAGVARRCAAFDKEHRYADVAGASFPLPPYCVPKP